MWLYVHFMKIAGIIGAEIIVFFSSSIGLSKSNKKKN